MEEHWGNRGSSIEKLVSLLSDTKKGNVTLYRELEERAREIGLPLEFTVERHYYRVDENGLWAVPIGHDGQNDAGNTEAISPEEYLDALRDHLLEQIDKLAASNHGLKELIRRFTRRKATWAELKKAAE
jgi:hypothetical protein